MSVGALDLLHTERLTLERLHPDHAPELMTLLRDPRVSRWISPDGQPPSERQVLDSLADKTRHWERFGFGLWLLRDRDTQEMVGRGGLQHTYVPGLQAIEIAWAIVPQRWNQGLATELANVSVQTGFETLGLRELIALTITDNIASRRVMEKSGFHFDRELEHVGLPHILYIQRAPRAGG